MLKTVIVTYLLGFSNLCHGQPLPKVRRQAPRSEADARSIPSVWNTEHRKLRTPYGILTIHASEWSCGLIAVYKAVLPSERMIARIKLFFDSR